MWKKRREESYKMVSRESPGVITPIRSIRELWEQYGNSSSAEVTSSMDALVNYPSRIRDAVPSTTSEMRVFLDLVRELLSAILKAGLLTDAWAAEERVTGVIGVLGLLFERDNFLYGPICDLHLNGIVSCENGCG